MDFWKEALISSVKLSWLNDSGLFSTLNHTTMWKDKRERRQMMEIEISFGKGRADQVLVHYGDDPFDLAKEFVRRHGLKEASVSTIGNYLDSTIQDFCANNPDPRDISDSCDSSQLDFDFDNVQTRFHNPLAEQPAAAEPAARSSASNDDLMFPELVDIPHSEHVNADNITTTQLNSNENRRSPSVTPPPRPVTPELQQPGSRLSSGRSTPSRSGSRADAQLPPSTPESHTNLPAASRHSPPVPSPLVISVPHNQQPSSGHMSGIASVHTPEYYLSKGGGQWRTQSEDPVDRLTASAARPQHAAKSQGSSPNHYHNTISHNQGANSNHNHNHDRYDRSQSEPPLAQYTASDLEFLDTLSGGDIDHRQFQENLDRKMNANMQSFSYRKIATELVASANKQPGVTHSQSQKCPATASIDNSHHSREAYTRHASEPISTPHTTLDPAAKHHQSHVPHSSERDDDQFTDGGYSVSSHVTHNTQLQHMSEHLQSQFSANQRALYPGSSSSGKQRTPSRSGASAASRSHDEGDRQRGVLPAYIHQPPQQQQQQQHDPFDADAPEYDERLNDAQQFYGGGENGDPARDAEEQEEEAPESQQLSTSEDMYNRLRNKTRQYIAEVKASAPTSKASRYQGSDSHHRADPHSQLPPHRTSLQMTDRKALNGQGWTHLEPNVLVGKNANERLYLTANIIKQKQHQREQSAARSFQQTMAAGQFRLNKNSAAIVQKLSKPRATKGGDDHIGLRLYDEGVRDKTMKTRRAENMRGIIAQSEDWSCARCGTYHKISSANIVIQPLHQVDRPNHQNNAGQLQNRVVKVCGTCGWDQGAVRDHQPINIGLALHENPEDVVTARRTGHDGIHEYLHQHAGQRDKFLLLNQALHEESINNTAATFKPSIPDSSKQIINKYRQQQHPAGDTGSITSAGASAAASAHNHAEPTAAGSKAVLSGPVLGEYFSQAPADRLSQRPARQVDPEKTLYKQQQPKSRQDAQKEKKSKPAIGLELSTAVPLPPRVDQFVHRLVYEYQEKAEKVQAASETLYSRDATTGQPLFQPVVQPLPSDLYNTQHVAVDRADGRKLEVHDDILLRDEQLRQKKLRAQQTEQRKELQQLQESQVKALDTSEAILRAATDRNLEELFRILLHQTGGFAAPTGGAGGGDSVDSSLDDAWSTESALDLRWVSGDLMIPEVSQLLRDMQREKAAEVQRLAQQAPDSVAPPTTSLPVNFDEFRRLALRCIRKKDGTGRNYVFAPRKKPEVAAAMIREAQQQETFRPALDKLSAELGQSRRQKQQEAHGEQPIELILQAEGDKLRGRMEAARREQVLRQAAELTFRPMLHRPPASVQPRYKGLDTLLADESFLPSSIDQSPVTQQVPSLRSTLSDATVASGDLPAPPPLLPSESRLDKPVTESSPQYERQSEPRPPLSRLRSESSLTSASSSPQLSPSASHPAKAASGAAPSRPVIKAKSKPAVGGIKAAKPALPLLPHELKLQQSKAASQLPPPPPPPAVSGAERLTDRAATRPPMAPLPHNAQPAFPSESLRDPKSRLSIESALTERTSATVVKKRH